MRHDGCVRMSLRALGFVFSLVVPAFFSPDFIQAGQRQYVTVHGSIRTSADSAPGPFVVELRGMSGMAQSDRTSYE